MKVKIGLILVLTLCLSALLARESSAREIQPPPKINQEITVYFPSILRNPRNGGWLDRITFVEETSADTAVTRLENGELDVFAYPISDPDIVQRVISSTELDYDYIYGSNYEITINPAGPLFNDGRLNPLNDPKIREALNWLIDRRYISLALMSNLAIPKWSPIGAVSADKARMAEVEAQIAQTYAYDALKAYSLITQEMQSLGGALVNGKWNYDGQPVIVIILIRTEDKRKDIGDYIANQLEVIGFTVDRQYKTNSQARPIWMESDPYEGIWHLYTGGWVSNLSRNDGGNFTFYYTPEGNPIPLWQAYTPTPEFHKVADQLSTFDFASTQERDDLFDQALWMAMQDSVHVWLVDLKCITPRRFELSVASDLADGVSGAQPLPYTLRRKGQMGGSAAFAQPGIMVNPWNPVAGSNWIYDQMPIRATGESALMMDPYTGLTWPLRIQRAEIVVKQDLLVSKSLDWIDLSISPEIQVPADAWVDWDPVKQKFITAGEKYPETQTANIKTTVYYPVDLFNTVKWHDGSPFSMGDFILRMILNFDRSKPESAIYDESTVAPVEAYMAHFKGLRILSTDPLTIETYDNEYSLDAELCVTSWFPSYDTGEGAWHAISLGILGEINNELAFSADKASLKQVEWINYISGPSLGILDKILDQAFDSNYIPYLPTMGQYVTDNEAQQRWANYQNWYDTNGHFWIGTGVYFLQEAMPLQKTLILERFPSYPDSLYKWSRYSGVPIPTVSLDGPTIVTIGSPATFTTTISFSSLPYKISDIDRVSFLLYDAQYQMISTGTATAIEDGLYQVDLTAEMTGLLMPGSGILKVVVISKLEVIPVLSKMEFTAMP